MIIYVSNMWSLNYESIRECPKIISKRRPFIDQYNWKEKMFPQDQKTGKSMKQTKPLLLMFCLYQKMAD